MMKDIEASYINHWNKYGGFSENHYIKWKKYYPFHLNERHRREPKNGN